MKEVLFKRPPIYDSLEIGLDQTHSPKPCQSCSKFWYYIQKYEIIRWREEERLKLGWGSLGEDVLGHFGAEIERTEKILEFNDNLQKESILRGISGQRINVSSRLFTK